MARSVGTAARPHPWVRSAAWDAICTLSALYGARIFGARAVALREPAWAPALVALGLTTGFGHYRLDRAVYRLSDRRVRAAARGLTGRP